MSQRPGASRLPAVGGERDDRRQGSGLALEIGNPGGGPGFPGACRGESLARGRASTAMLSDDFTRSIPPWDEIVISQRAPILSTSARRTWPGPAAAHRSKEQGWRRFHARSIRKSVIGLCPSCRGRASAPCGPTHNSPAVTRSRRGFFVRTKSGQLGRNRSPALARNRNPSVGRYRRVVS